MSHPRNKFEGLAEGLRILTARPTGNTVALAVALPKKRKAPLTRRGAYTHALITASQARAARAVEVDLVALKQEIDAADSYDDLKRRILRAYRAMDSNALAKIVEKAQLMASLAGRLGAIEEL